ncbi:YdeI/OmpD-associated family protein [Fulvivirga lutimaris]|uniref:YdeI/OmpD-associated family protein n=1 Tax=Fulvivirga lutimaris TaxID=1819566 RepID=UPI0012BB9E7B|nr:YdeI/OmpD-associated family protein [Fulvivirga lutimaris]MTI40210.1 bacteriocin-protection protein [Fulvivirga lutimaris]
MSPTFFPTPADFRKWLAKNHKTSTELIVGYYKVATGKPSITWPESVDQALCFGWIDGIRRSVDEESYSVRFTPRRPDSFWSTVNINKVEALTKQGLMMPAGIKAFELRTEKNSRVYSFENEAQVLPADYQKIFKANKKAWQFFKNLAPSYYRTSVHWIVSAKQEKTRLSRLEKIIAASEKHENPWRSAKKK